MYLFTSEVVAPGHPDKCADIISDSIVDALIIKDSQSRVASEDTFFYADVASRGQVGQSDYPWEQLDELDLFKSLA